VRAHTTSLPHSRGNSGAAACATRQWAAYAATCARSSSAVAAVRRSQAWRLQCRLDNAPEGANVKACGMYIC